MIKLDNKGYYTIVSYQYDTCTKMKKTLPSEVNSFKIKSCYFEKEKGEENTQGKGQRNLLILDHL